MRFRSPAFFFVVIPMLVSADPTISVVPQKSSALYQLNEPIIWNVKVDGDPGHTLTTASYDLKEGGAKDIGHGVLNFVDGVAKIQTSLAEPGTILAEVTTPGKNGHPGLRALGGAAVAYDKIQCSAPRPPDFDAFWKSKLDFLSRVPANAVLEKGDSEHPGVDYWKVTFDNVDGAHVHGQLARPSGTQKVPAMLIVQWAGVYPLQKKWVTDRAAQGWLVLNVLAHDLPIDQPKSFYDDKALHELKDYTAIGATDRDKSYFLHMFLGDLQASHYLAARPDWNGKTFVVTGTSQGGLQSFVVAALDPTITDMLVLVPAGCDDSGALAGRKPGWPFHLENPTAEQQPILKTSAYFDAVNFAVQVKCSALVAPGLIDETAPPSGIFAAFNQLQGPKEACVLPLSNHHGLNNAQAAYSARASEWLKALLKGDPAPVRAVTNP